MSMGISNDGRVSSPQLQQQPVRTTDINEGTHTAWNVPLGLGDKDLGEVRISVGKLREMIGRGTSKNKGYVRFVSGVDANGNRVATIDKVGNKLDILINRRRNLTPENNVRLRDAVATALGHGAKYMDETTIKSIQRALVSTKIGVDTHAANQEVESTAKERLGTRIKQFFLDKIHAASQKVTVGKVLVEGLKAFANDGLGGAAKAMGKQVLTKVADKLAQKIDQQLQLGDSQSPLSRKELKEAFAAYDGAFTSLDGRKDTLNRMLRNLTATVGLDGVPDFELQGGTAGELEQRLAQIKLALAHRAQSARDADATSEAIARAAQTLGQLEAACRGNLGVDGEGFIELLASAETALTAELRKVVLDARIASEIEYQTNDDTASFFVKINSDVHAQMSELLAQIDGSQQIGGLPGTGGVKARLFTDLVLPAMMDHALKQIQLQQLTSLSKEQNPFDQLRALYLKSVSSDRVMEMARRFMNQLDTAADCGTQITAILAKGDDATDDDMAALFRSSLAFTADFITAEGLQTQNYGRKLVEEQNEADQLHKKTLADLDVPVENLGDPTKELTRTQLEENLATKADEFFRKHVPFKVGDQGETSANVNVSIKNDYLPKLIRATLERTVSQARVQNLDAAAARRQLMLEYKAALEKLESVYSCLGSKQRETDFVTKVTDKVTPVLERFRKHGVQLDLEASKLEVEIAAKAAYQQAFVDDFLKKLDGHHGARDVKALYEASSFKQAKEKAIADLTGGIVLNKLIEPQSGTDGEKVSAGVVNTLCGSGVFRKLIENTVNAQVDALLQNGRKVPSGNAFPSVNTLREEMTLRLKALWNESMGRVPPGTGRNWFLEKLAKMLSVFDSKDLKFQVDAEWLEKVNASFAERAKAEFDAYTAFGEKLVATCRQKIADKVADAVKGQDVPGDVRDTLTQAVLHRYEDVTRAELVQLLRSAGALVKATTNKQLDVISGNVLASRVVEGKDTLEDVVASEIERACSEVRQVLEQDDTRVSYEVSGYTLLNATREHPENSDFIRDVRARTTFKVGADAPDALSESEAISLGDAAVKKAYAKARANPLAFLNTASSKTQEKLLLEAATEAGALAKEYRALRTQLHGKIGASAPNLPPEQLGTIRKIVTADFAARFGAYVQNEASAEDIRSLVDSSADLYVGIVRDAESGIVHASVKDFLATNEIEDTLRRSLDVDFDVAKMERELLPPDLAQKLPQTFGALHGRFTSLHEDLAVQLRARAAQIHRRETTDSSQRDKLVAETKTAFRTAFASLANEIGRIDKELKLGPEELLALADRNFREQTQAETGLFDGSHGNVDALKDFLSRRYTEQESTEGWRAQYDASLAKILDSVNNVNAKLSSEEITVEIGAFHRNTAMAGILDILIANYNGECERFARALDEMSAGKGLSSVTQTNLQNDFKTHIAAGLKGFVDQFTALDATAEITRLDQILARGDFWNRLRETIEKDVAKRSETLFESISNGAKTELESTFRELAKKQYLPPFDASKAQRLGTLPPRERVFYGIYATAQSTTFNTIQEQCQMVDKLSGTNWTQKLADALADVHTIFTNYNKGFDADVSIQLEKFDRQEKAFFLSAFRTVIDDVISTHRKTNVFSSSKTTAVHKNLFDQNGNPDADVINMLSAKLLSLWRDRGSFGTVDPFIAFITVDTANPETARNDEQFKSAIRKEVIGILSTPAN